MGYDDLKVAEAERFLSSIADGPGSAREHPRHRLDHAGR
jgi:hypothetical protein